MSSASIIRNPRTVNSFKYPYLTCSICNQPSSYLILLEPYHLCKGCLTNFISKIDNTLLEDVKDEHKE